MNPISDLVPITWSQEAIWYQSESEPEDFQYGFNIPVVVSDIEVPLDDVTAAIVRVVQRYETLRTTLLRADPGSIFQQVWEAAHVDVAVHKVATREESVALGRAKLRAMYMKGFDLYSDLPIRFSAMVGPGDIVFDVLIVMHHIAVDYWS